MPSGGAGGRHDRGRNTIKGRPPTRGAAAQISRRPRSVVSIKGIGWSRCIALEIDASQPDTVCKRIFLDVGNATADDRVSQADATGKRAVSDADDAVGNRYAGQGTIRKRINPDAGDAAGNGVTSPQATRKLDECRLSLVKQHAAETAVKQVGNIHRYVCQTVAIQKRILPDTADAAGNGHGGETKA